MFWRILLIVLVTLAVGLTGCKKEEPEIVIPQAVEEVEKEAEATEDVDVEAEVDRIEKEVEAEMEADK